MRDRTGFVGVCLIALALSCILAGCDHDEESSALDYFPLRKGYYLLYDVEETVYSEVEAPAFSQYQVRLQVVDSISAANGFAYVMHRSTRPALDDEWTYVDTWTIYKEYPRLIIKEGSTDFVKLAFPATTGRTWDGNEYNDLGTDEYEVTSLNESYNSGDLSFPNALTVTQSNNDDFIVFLDQRTEVYAPGIGLVAKNTTQLRYCTIDPNCVGQQQILDGIVYSQTLRAYGY